MPYRRLPAWVLGFHGTDEETVGRILIDPQKCLSPSRNDYDWLGDGIYFWENDPVRARSYIEEKFARNKLTAEKAGLQYEAKKPAVIGAVIDLGLCLNLFDQTALVELAAAHNSYQRTMEKNHLELPMNKGGSDRLQRFLDRAVFEWLHMLRGWSPESTPSYDTIRSGFHEGGPVYPGAGFQAKNHIQIAVRQSACIKGFFLPRGLEVAYPRGYPLRDESFNR